MRPFQNPQLSVVLESSIGLVPVGKLDLRCLTVLPKAQEAQVGKRVTMQWSCHIAWF